MAYHYDPEQALLELDEKALLPNPVHIRDMLSRTALPQEKVIALTRLFLEYQKQFAETMKLGREYLTVLVQEGTPKDAIKA